MKNITSTLLVIAFMATAGFTTKVNADFGFQPKLKQCIYSHGVEDTPSGLTVYDYKFIVGGDCPPPQEPYEGHITDNYIAVDNSGLLFEGHTRDRVKCKVRLNVVGGHIE